MANLFLQFPCRLAKSGYAWVKARSALDPSQSPCWFLTDGHPIGAVGLHVIEYQPLVAFPGLFRVFADTEPARDGIKAFADRFGPLGRTVEKPIPLDDQRNAKEVLLGMGESLADWHHEILTMRLAIDIWEAVRRGDVNLLGQLILWNDDGSGVRIMSHPELTDRQLPDRPAYVERAWIANTHHGDDVLGRFVRGDLVKPALHYVQSTINQHLENRIGARLLWDTKRARLDLYTSPVDLIGAVWLQFARAVERDSKFRQCAECGTWFELAPGTARADKLYCSTPCRTKAYRKRQAEAVRLHGEARSLEDIARDLDSEPDTVRGWIERSLGADGSPEEWQ